MIAILYGAIGGFIALAVAELFARRKPRKDIIVVGDSVGNESPRMRQLKARQLVYDALAAEKKK